VIAFAAPLGVGQTVGHVDPGHDPVFDPASRITSAHEFPVGHRLTRSGRPRWVRWVVGPLGLRPRHLDSRSSLSLSPSEGVFETSDPFADRRCGSALGPVSEVAQTAAHHHAGGDLVVGRLAHGPLCSSQKERVDGGEARGAVTLARKSAASSASVSIKDFVALLLLERDGAGRVGFPIGRAGGGRADVGAGSVSARELRSHLGNARSTERSAGSSARDSVGLQRRDDAVDRGAGCTKNSNAFEYGALTNIIYKSSALVGGEAEGDGTGAFTARLLGLEGRLGPLADGLALPLAHARQYVQHETTGSRAGVDVVANGQQGETRPEVLLDQRAEVANRAGQPIELRDQQAVGVAGVEESESALQTGPVERAGAFARVDHHVDQLQVVEVGVLPEAGDLRFEPQGRFGLSGGADANVTENAGSISLHSPQFCNSGSTHRTVTGRARLCQHDTCAKYPNRQHVDGRSRHPDQGLRLPYMCRLSATVQCRLKANRFLHGSRGGAGRQDGRASALSGGLQALGTRGRPVRCRRDRRPISPPRGLVRRVGA